MTHWPWKDSFKHQCCLLLPWNGKMRLEEGPPCIGAKVCPMTDRAKEQAQLGPCWHACSGKVHVCVDSMQGTLGVDSTWYEMRGTCMRRELASCRKGERCAQRHRMLGGKITGILCTSVLRRGMYVCACDIRSLGDTLGADSMLHETRGALVHWNGMDSHLTVWTAALIVLP